MEGLWVKWDWDLTIVDWEVVTEVLRIRCLKSNLV